MVHKAAEGWLLGTGWLFPPTPGWCAGIVPVWISDCIVGVPISAGRKKVPKSAHSWSTQKDNFGNGPTPICNNFLLSHGTSRKPSNRGKDSLLLRESCCIYSLWKFVFIHSFSLLNTHSYLTFAWKTQSNMGRGKTKQPLNICRKWT